MFNIDGIIHIIVTNATSYKTIVDAYIIVFTHKILVAINQRKLKNMKGKLL